MPNDYSAEIMDIGTKIAQIESDLKALNDTYYRNNFTSLQDFNKASRFNSRLRVPVFDVAPTTGAIGELYANSTTGKLYVCTAITPTWSLVGTQT